MNFVRISIVTALLGLVAGCYPVSKPDLPAKNILSQGMADILIDTGFYQEVGITRTVGHLFLPEENSWKIFACFQFTDLQGGVGETCVDSFRAMMLENGRWVVAVTIEENYRWRILGVSFDTPASEPE